MKLLRQVYNALFFAVLIWGAASFLGSMTKSSSLMNSCGRNFPVDYIIYTNLFCEIKD